MAAVRMLAFAALAAIVLRQHDADFVAHTIDTGLTGGYQVVVSDLNRDGRPDVIALASGLKELRWYENPNWQKHVLATGISQAINAAAFDIDGDGIPEIALAYEFSNVHAKSAGIVSLLTHQGDPREPWSMKEIDRVPTSRLGPRSSWNLDAHAHHEGQSGGVAEERVERRHRRTSGPRTVRGDNRAMAWQRGRDLPQARTLLAATRHRRCAR